MPSLGQTRDQLECRLPWQSPRSIGLCDSSLVMRRASANLENSFVTANFASARAQLSKLERQRVLPPNCGQIMKKTTTVHLSQLHDNPPNFSFAQHFLFNNTWTKIQLRSDPVNMQPDKTKCYPQRPITTLWPAASKILSTSSGSPPPNSGTLSLHMERNCTIRRGAAGYWNVTLATTRWHAGLDVLRPIFHVGKARFDGSLKFV